MYALLEELWEAVTGIKKSKMREECKGGAWMTQGLVNRRSICSGDGDAPMRSCS